jgi:hypothetical protein
MNYMLLVGPTVQQYLYFTVFQSRTQQFAFIADIAKMCRQVNIHHDVRNLQRLLW